VGRVGAVGPVGSRRAAEPCVGVVDTCSGQSPAGGQTFAVVTPVVSSAGVKAAGTLAFEAGAAAEAPTVHHCPQSLAAYAADDTFQKNGVLGMSATIRRQRCAHTWRTAWSTILFKSSAWKSA